MNAWDRTPSGRLVSMASPERVAGVFVLVMASVVAFAFLLGRAPGTPVIGAGASPIAPPATSASASPLVSAVSDLASLRGAATLNDQMAGLADDLEDEIARDRSTADDIIESMRQVNAVTVAVGPVIARLSGATSTRSVGEQMHEIYDGIHRTVAAALANGRTSTGAYVRAASATVKLIQSLAPIQLEILKMGGAQPSAVPSPVPSASQP